MAKTYSEQIVDAAKGTGTDPDWLLDLLEGISMGSAKLSDQIVSSAYLGRDPTALRTILANAGVSPARILSAQIMDSYITGEDPADLIAIIDGDSIIVVPEGYPDASNTGYTSALEELATDFEGGITYSTEGGTIEGKNITGHIRVSANNVTIRNCLITASSFWVVFVEEGVTGFRMFDCELDGMGVTGKGFLGTGIVMRCNIHDCADSIGFTAANCLAAGNYLHDNLTSDPDPHYDGMDVTGSNTLVVHNTIVNPATQTSAIFVENEAVDPEANPTTNIRIADNILSGGGYTIYTGGPGTTDVQFLDNILTSGFYGYVNEFGPLTEPATFTGNVSSIDSSPVNETVAGPLACYGVPLVEASEDVAITPFTVTAKGGTPPYTFAKVATWPTGLSVHATTGVVSGTPTQSGSFPNAAVRVTDSLDNEAELSMWGLEVAAATSTITETIFDHSGTAPGTSPNNGNEINLGVVFRPVIAGVTVTHVSFWKRADDASTSHQVAVWAQAGGAALATGTSSGEPTGVAQWIDVALDTPLSVTNGEYYVASYLTNASGQYSATATAFASTDYGTNVLAYRSSSLLPFVGNGRFNDTNTLTYPDQSFNNTNYFVDIKYEYEG